MPDNIIIPNAFEMAVASSSYSAPSQLLNEWFASIDPNMFVKPNASTPTSGGIGATRITVFPLSLVRLFVAGGLMFLVGLLLLLLFIFVHIETVNFLGIALLTMGSVIVALTLLRGQDVVERVH